MKGQPTATTDQQVPPTDQKAPPTDHPTALTDQIPNQVTDDISDQILTRTATLNDLDTLLRFEQGVIAAERPFDDTLKKGDIHYYDLAGMIAAPHIEVVVATLGETIVGSGYARIEDSKHFYQYKQHAYLGFMYVSPDHRGQGVNQKIISALKRWALSRNLTEMCLEVYAGNLAAIKAYEKAGFVSNLIQMRLGLKE